jgi:PST family polysaccharide transporter
MQLITLVTLIARVLFAVLVFLFIRDKDDGILFLFFLGAGNVIAGLLSLVIAFRIYKLKFSNPGLAVIVKELKDGWQITLSHLSNCTCHYANIFILRFFATDIVVGYYAIAERIFFTIRQVFVVFSQAVYPAVSQVVQKGKDQAISFLKQTYSWFLLSVATGCLLLFIFSPGILYFFIGKEYTHAVFFLRVFCVIAVIVCLNIPGTLILLATDQKNSYLKVYAVATLLNILLNIVLAGFYQATGTVLAILITELFITIGLTRVLYRQNEIRANWVNEPPGNIGY